MDSQQVAEDEEWRDIPGFEGHYQASTQGRIRSVDRYVTLKNGIRRLHRGVVRAPTEINSGYLMVPLSVANKQVPMTVHRAVMLTFVGPRPDGMEVCHLNGDKHDNRLENLRYDSKSANAQDRKAHGTYWRSLRDTHCTKGHEYTPENSKPTKGGGRTCRTCANAATRAHYRNHPEYYKARHERNKAAKEVGA